jgi:hypothetical protein
VAGKIFINYRRVDTLPTAGRLYEWLAKTFGRKNLFMDVDTIPIGVEFPDYIVAKVGACKVILALIGPRWLDVRTKGFVGLTIPRIL